MLQETKLGQSVSDQAPIIKGKH